MQVFKKLVGFFLVLALTAGLAGCGSSSQTGKTEEQTPKTQEAQSQPKNQSTNAAYKDAEAKLLEALAPLPKVSKPYKIAALEITLANPFWVTVKQGYEDAAKEYGVSVDVLSAPKEDDVNSQLDALKTLLAKDYNAIALSAITPFNLVPGVAEATKKGIPVVAVGTGVDADAAKKANAKIAAFITSDFAEQGKLGADFIMKKAGSGKVAIIEGLPGAAQSEARKTGAKKAFEANKNFQLVSVQAGNWDRKIVWPCLLIFSEKAA